MLQTPDGNGRLELFEYVHPDAIETEPTRPMRMACSAWPSRSTTSTRRRTYVRGSSGIIVILAQELKKS
jgi:glyoxylase I family protein